MASIIKGHNTAQNSTAQHRKHRDGERTLRLGVGGRNINANSFQIRILNRLRDIYRSLNTLENHLNFLQSIRCLEAIQIAHLLSADQKWQDSISSKFRV